MKTKKITCLLAASLFLINTVSCFGGLPTVNAEEVPSEIQSDSKDITIDSDKITEDEALTNSDEEQLTENEEAQISNDEEESETEEVPEEPDSEDSNEDLNAEDSADDENKTESTTDNEITEDTVNQENSDKEDAINEEDQEIEDSCDVESYGSVDRFYAGNACFVTDTNSSMRVSYYKDSINKYTQDRGIIDPNDSLEVKVNGIISYYNTENFSINGLDSSYDFQINKSDSTAIIKIPAGKLKSLKPGEHTLSCHVSYHSDGGRYSMSYYYDYYATAKFIIEDQNALVKYTDFDITGLPTDESAFEFQDGEITGLNIAAEDKEKVSTIKIPKTIGDKEVSKIGASAFEGFTNLTKVDIDASLSSLGYRSFADCTKLERINLPDELTSIGKETFKNCALTNINIPYKCNDIDKTSFEGCNIGEITVVGGSDAENAYQKKRMEKIIKNTDIIKNVRSSVQEYYYKTNSQGNLTVYRIDIPFGTKEIFGQDYPCTTYPDLSLVKVPVSTYISCSEKLFAAYVLDEHGYNCYRKTDMLPEYDTTINKNALEKELGTNNTYNVAVRLSDSDSIFEGKKGNNRITEVQIAGNMKVLKDNVFKNCKNLTKVIIPYGCDINRTTFQGCYNIDEITVLGAPSDEERLAVKEKVEQSIMGEGERITVASYADGSSENAVIDDTIFNVEDGIITSLNISDEDRGKLKSIRIPHEVDGVEIKGLGENLFENCTSLSSVQIADSVEAIGNAAFVGCSSLTDLNIPDSVMEINDALFSGCSNLTSVNLPSSLTKIGSFAFMNCIKLENIDIPSTVNEIDGAAFYNCWSLQKAAIPDSVSSLGQYAFGNCASVDNIRIPYNCTDFDKTTFQGDNKLKSIIVNGGSDYEKAYLEEKVRRSIDGEEIDPDYVPVIKEVLVTYADGASEYAVTDDTIFTVNNGTITGLNVSAADKIKIASIKVPSEIDGQAITGITNDLFNGCTSLSKVELSDGLQSIGNGAFVGCSSLTSVVIPEGVTEINDALFSGCSNLVSVTLPDSLTKIGPYAFLNCVKLKNINIPDSVTEMGVVAFYNCWGLESVKLSEGLKAIPASAFNSCINLVSITIPESIESIGDSAFASCKKLNEMSFPDTITSMGMGVLENCTNIQTVKLPKNIITISEKMFKNCTNLQTIKLPYIVTDIGDEAFYGCPKLTNMDMQK